MSVVLLAVLWMSSAAPALAAGTDAASSAKAKLANVSHTVKEADLNAITLSAEAEKSLGITVAKVENKAIGRSRVYGGEVVIPGDRALMVQAPFTGVVQLHGKPIRPGEMVRKGQAILELVPMLSPESRINLEVSLTDMQGQLGNAETQQNIAAIALKRAQQLFEDKAGSQRNVQEAQAVFDQAADTLKALKQRRQLIVDALSHQGSGKVVLRSPIDAILAA
jgi:cobalt-zinc-cadmium efflux system membrane fusion protein